jgi:hypothetical protein
MVIRHLDPKVVDRVYEALDPKISKSVDELCAAAGADDLMVIHALYILSEQGKVTHAMSKQIYDPETDGPVLLDQYLKKEPPKGKAG